MTLTSRLCASVIFGLCLGSPGVADTLLVTTLDPVGAGSLQAALDAAGASAEHSTIMITIDGAEIVTPQGLIYRGASPVVIYGNGVTVTSPRNVTLLSLQDARSVGLHDMAFVGPGGFNIMARGDATGPAGKGIFLDVAENAEGRINLRLVGVHVADVAGHGIHISDCTLADACGGGEGGDGDGSPASIAVDLAAVSIEGVGQGSFDADGLRVDERGPGDITLTGMYINVSGVGADGIELDEGQAGDVVVDLIHADFIENGNYCDPALLGAFMPDPPEGEFREFEVILDDLPQPSPDTPDMACIELEVDTFEGGSVEEYEYSIDVDDGLDIDEAGPGSIIASFSVGQMIGNYDEGYDFDEAGSGDIDVVFTGIIGNGNIDDAIKLSEEGPGSVYVSTTAVEASSNGGVGIVAEEEDGGDLVMLLNGSSTAGNDGGALGVEAIQQGNGEGNVYVIDSEIADGIETDGAVIDAD